VNQSESGPPLQRDSPITSWVEGYLAFGLTVLFGVFQLYMEIMGIARGWYSDAARFRGVGPWFQWCLAAQAGFAGLIALLGAQLWLRDRVKTPLQIGFFGAVFGAFALPSHAPKPGDTSWYMYSFSVCGVVGSAICLAYYIAVWSKHQPKPTHGRNS
jgi:hypothetical protein